jgi:hypothetical protein
MAEYIWIDAHGGTRSKTKVRTSLALHPRIGDRNGQRFLCTSAKQIRHDAHWSRLHIRVPRDF